MRTSAPTYRAHSLEQLLDPLVKRQTGFGDDNQVQIRPLVYSLRSSSRKRAEDIYLFGVELLRGHLDKSL